jgi:hypothetical protein
MLIEQNVSWEADGGSDSQEIPYSCSGINDGAFSDFNAPGSDLLNPEMEAAFFPNVYHPTALHSVQTQKVKMWRSPLRFSLFWDVTQRRFIVTNVSGQSVLTSRAKQSKKSFVFLWIQRYKSLSWMRITGYRNAVFEITFHIIFICTPSSHKWNPNYRFLNRRCMHIFCPRCWCIWIVWAVYRYRDCGCCYVVDYI